MKTALFVDIDGVFHAEDSRRFEYEGSALVVADSPELFQWAPILWSIIKPYPDLMIVVHSSWRHLYPAEEIVARFPALMQPRIAGVTAGRDRNLSILAYVEANAIERFAVLDDRADNFPADWPPLILCDSQQGINDPEVLMRIRRFVAG